MSNEIYRLPGWDEYTKKSAVSIENGFVPGRVTEVLRDRYTVMTEEGECEGLLAGKFFYEIDQEEGLPVVGDYVAGRKIDGENKIIVEEVLPRENFLNRNRPGKENAPQAIAANIDIIFIVQGLDGDFNLPRLERYLLLCRESGIEGAVILNKIDVCPDFAAKYGVVKEISGTSPVHCVSAVEKKNIDEILDYFNNPVTAAFLGSSGTGKSTIINNLLGRETQRVSNVRLDDSRGRHTTTSRQLFYLEGGGAVIDTPGMRELEPWNASDNLDEIFMDISNLAQLCRFKDCLHESEPGCAVREAIEKGELDPRRLKNYNKMKKEQEYQRSLVSDRAGWEKRRSDKKFQKMCRNIIKEKQKYR